MPKAVKKKKEKVADFSKSKLKLGKGKATPTNVIDTSFKARSIALPSQSIANEKDTTQPTTRRQLNFNDLISHLKHYNAGTRKDALIGLRELLDANWDILYSCLTPLINATVRLIGDEDAGVRKQLLSFMSWLLPKIPREDLAPHSPALLLFTTSAQTHIFPEIRIDAVRFLDILLDCIPESVVSGWCELADAHGSRVLSGYLGILNAGTKYGETEGPLKATSTASVVLTPASKLVVLKSLSTFLREALHPFDAPESPSSSQTARTRIDAGTSLDTTFLKSAFPSLRAYHAFESLLASQASSKSLCQPWRAEVEPDDDFGDVFVQSFPLLEESVEPWSLHDFSTPVDFSNLNENTSSSRQASTSFVAHLAGTLHSTIIETYLDCAPSVFSPGSTPTDVELQLVVTIVRIAQSLYHVLLQCPEDVDQEHIIHLEDIVNYMAPYFPSSTRDGKLEQSYEEFNLIFCELTSLAVNASPRSQKRRKTTKGKTRLARGNPTIQTERVTQYIIRRLRGEAASPSQIGYAISPMAYRTLLPTIWALINHEDPTAGTEGSTEMLHSVLDHALKVPSKSACKRITIEFVARLMLLSLEPHYQAAFNSEKDAAVKDKFDTWFLQLPQVLWELGSSNLANSETILRVLLRTLQRRPKASQQSTAIAALQARLVPFFYIDHPVRGAVPGPYKKLPGILTSRIRLLVLDVTSTILALGKQDGKEFDGLSRVVGLAVTGEGEESYWADISSMNRK
ncbi:hypothetical protein D9613_001877 [Agrocybe pediades]|uniref:Pre-rRNA-processing protein n=1 Tax=Agrocybe pediades TaxID=84607 RepID=A0A8H4R731_9AGAR|nr:hypothetical protein D9613_001877 [Agrocybe pediades]